MTPRGRIVVVGGYGAVGREAAAALVRLLPQAQIMVAGRHPSTAPPIPGATSIRLDATDDDAVAHALAGTDAVLMCAEIDNARLARACLERGVHYVDVTATYRRLTPIEDLDQLARDRDATAVLSVGLAPGVTNLLARHRVELAGVDAAGIDVEIGVLLGSGDRHGAAATGWTLDALAELGSAWNTTFPPPYGERRVRRFPFSDQYTLPRTLGVRHVRTGLCLDSRLATSLMAVGRLPPVTRTLARPGARRAVLAALGRMHVGSDGFAVSASAAGMTSSFSGRRQSRATGLAVALTAVRLDALPSGVWHLDQVVDPREFLTGLATHGFDLQLDAMSAPG